MALPNPSFQLKTHRWRPGVCAASWQVPAKLCAAFGQEQPFFAKNSPQARVKRPKEEKWWLHYTCGMNSVCQRAV